MAFGCRQAALLLQALLFWVPSAGPFNCTWGRVSAGQCANVPAGGGFHAQSVCVSGVSDAATSCLKS